VDDVKSNGGEDGELKLREARLEFRGSKKEDSEVEGRMGKGCLVWGSKVTVVSRDAHEARRQP
jgi:hypothetical protein